MKPRSLALSLAISTACVCTPAMACDPNDPNSPGYPCQPYNSRDSHPESYPDSTPVKAAPEMGEGGCLAAVAVTMLVIRKIRKRDKKDGA